MKRNILFLVLYSLFCDIGTSQTQTPKVCLDGSTCALGIFMRGFQTYQYEAFLGIPYAKPPIGNLRFKNPVKADLWEGTISAKKPKQDCIQKNYLTPTDKISGSEDCLYLNVYRPLHRSSENLPVMFYIHGGGFFSGSASPYVEGPEYFMDTNEVILVVSAYRVGPFGFLSTGDAEMSGNFGLKDQNLALKWVQEHISAFGGDPTRVTIFGHNAGAASVHFHMLSPASNGLFQNAILMSGAATGPYVKPLRNPKAQVIDLAVAVGIKKAYKLRSTELVRALQKINPTQLLRAVDFLKSWNVYPLINFRPNIENGSSAESFLTNETFSLLAENPNSISVPWIIGNVPSKGEGTVIALRLASNSKLQKEFNSNFDVMLRTVLDLPRNVLSDDAIDRLVSKYMGGVRNVNDYTINGFLELLGDAYYVYPTYKTIKTSLGAESVAEAVAESTTESATEFMTESPGDLSWEATSGRSTIPLSVRYSFVSRDDSDNSSAYDEDNSSAGDSDDSSIGDSDNSSAYDPDNSSASDSDSSSERDSDNSSVEDSDNSSAEESDDSSDGDSDNSSVDDSDNSSAYDPDNSSTWDSDDSSDGDSDNSSESDSDNSSVDDSDNSSAYDPDNSSAGDSDDSSEGDSDDSSSSESGESSEKTTTQLPENSSTSVSDGSTPTIAEKSTTSNPTTGAAEDTTTSATEETTNPTTEETLFRYQARNSTEVLKGEARMHISEDIENNVTNLIGIIKFNYRGPYSYSKTYSGNLKNFGTVHGDDSLYLFKSSSTFPRGYFKRSAEAALIKRYVGLYVEFAKTGKVKEFENIDTCTKEGFRLGECNYLSIVQDTEPFQIDNNWNIERMQLWEDIYGIQ